MERVEELMAKRKWVKHCLRTNCAAPEDCVLTGKIEVAQIFFNLRWQRANEPELDDEHQTGGEKTRESFSTRI